VPEQDFLCNPARHKDGQLIPQVVDGRICGSTTKLGPEQLGYEFLPYKIDVHAMPIADTKMLERTGNFSENCTHA
jgi:hypothetical protein